MDDAKRSVNCAARDFVAASWRGDAGPVPCGECSACCYYDGIPVDKKRDRRHLPHLLTERNCDGDLVRPAGSRRRFQALRLNARLQPRRTAASEPRFVLYN